MALTPYRLLNILAKQVITKNIYWNRDFKSLRQKCSVEIVLRIEKGD